ncbi:MAG: hypothetical protein HQK51_11720 [Oligoflexia bacterium]|nr:hypothetical protein [Oligoflexia bacterium]
MSEYQYYEFHAVDRSLTDEEMNELRSFSTRAEITANSFVNEYSWGNFKGNEDRWMEKYFDGYLYYANWGTHVLKLRLPLTLLDLQTVQAYLSGDNFSARISDDKIILEFFSESENGGEWEKNWQLSSFLSLRLDLARGDLRCLYLAWLSNLQNNNQDKEYEEYEEYEENEEDYEDNEKFEPPVPPGLAELTPALTSFADFLRVDPDLLTVAAKMSPALKEVTPNLNDLRSWVAALPINEKENLLTDILENSMRGDQTVAMRTVRRFNKEWQSRLAALPGNITIRPDRKRTVAELLKNAEHIAEIRKREELERAAAKQAEQQRLAKLAREKRLNEIASSESLLWKQIESLVAEKKSTSYNKAIELLIDLRDLAARGDNSNFLLKLNAFKKRHSAKSSLMARLSNMEKRPF